MQEAKSQGQIQYELWREQIVCPKMPVWSDLNMVIRELWERTYEKTTEEGTIRENNETNSKGGLETSEEV